MFVMW